MATRDWSGTSSSIGKGARSLAATGATCEDAAAGRSRKQKVTPPGRSRAGILCVRADVFCGAPDPAAARLRGQTKYQALAAGASPTITPGDGHDVLIAPSGFRCPKAISKKLTTMTWHQRYPMVGLQQEEH